ncbi:MAG: hypothetical protein INR73_24355 [Williamsia sp.]|nr:hypothetical protein [Williamsia sp.]
MKTTLFSVLLCCALASCFAQTKYREEFNGPFASWANVKTRFRAAGDGVKDDTQALQTALDSLSRTLKTPFNTQGATRYVVVYLPAGTYRISRTLRLEGRTGVTFIGEDPLKTKIKWAGGDNDTMFFSNKSAEIRISRLTWDADNRKNIVAVGLHFKDHNEPYFGPTFMELSDMVFTGNPACGLSCGTYGTDGTGIMDSEFTIRRCKFYNATEAGILIKGFNALDYWVWDCEFNRCARGIQCSHGNYHVYQSHFYNSAVADCQNKDVMYSSVRNCYSENAAAFSVDEGASCNAFKRIFQANIVKNSQAIPIQYHHLGKITLLNNYFYNKDKPTQQAVDYTSWCSGNYDVLSIENAYTEDRPINLPQNFQTHLHGLEDKKFVFARSKEPAAKPLPPFVPLVKRQVFEVPVNATGKTIQAIINKAAALKGQRAVVHFPQSDFYIEQSITVPAESDIQLLGDGVHASIFRTKSDPGPAFFYFTINGPSYITIRDLQVGQDGTTDNSNAFLFTGIDQPKSRVLLDQINSNSSNTLYIDKLNYTYFEKNNSFFTKGNTLIGGDKVKAGTGTSKLYCFGGQSAGVHLENGATMVARDCWWEGSNKKDFLPLNLTGNGNLTVDGAMYAPTDADSGAVVVVGNFSGRISLLNMYLIGSIRVQPNPATLKMLVWNVNMYHKTNPVDFLKAKTSAQIAMLGISTQCFKQADKNCTNENPLSVPDKLVNVSTVESFLKELTSDNRRANPQPYTYLAAGVTNLYISRVFAYTAKGAFTFRQ